MKQEIKQEEIDSCSGAPPPKRMKSVESNIASPMSMTNPSTPGSYKPPTPVQSCTPNPLQGPKTPQSHPSLTATAGGDQKFAVPSPVGLVPVVTSQPQLVRQQSLPAGPPSNRPDGSCHLAPQGKQGVVVKLSKKFVCTRLCIFVLNRCGLRFYRRAPNTYEVTRCATDIFYISKYIFVYC